MAIEPRQPDRLEKKKNTGLRCYPWGATGNESRRPDSNRRHPLYESPQQEGSEDPSGYWGDIKDLQEPLF
jgi:hypothetical protein